MENPMECPMGTCDEQQHHCCWTCEVKNKCFLEEGHWVNCESLLVNCKNNYKCSGIKHLDEDFRMKCTIVQELQEGVTWK